ncbi:hypothetical protein ES703_115959 [subsurface metagenome]
MSELPDESVQCVVTSPPYWGLRKYSGVPDLIWGGDENCEHEWVEKTYLLSDKWCYAEKNIQHKGKMTEEQFISAAQAKRPMASICSLCGAWKGSYGLEPNPELYISHSIEILREIRRVLRKDGVVFWNIGDSYWGGGQHHGDKNIGKQTTGQSYGPIDKTHNHNSLKPKDLCLIPFRIAIAAQEDGWWVRSVIIWSKPNPMPESVKDRPTESHEYILMLTKSAKYYWDQEAVREPYSPTERWGGEMYKGSKIEYPNKEDAGLARERSCYPNIGRNIRTVWQFPTKPGPSGAVRNFAVFPEKLPEICIEAATPEVGCCSKCGAPWSRVIKKGFTNHNGATRTAYPEGSSAKRLALLRQAARQRGAEYQNIKETLGWHPTCKCNADKIPSLVLDPFLGSGTTLWVAKRLGRRGVGYELSEDYCALALERNRQMVMELAS